MSGRAAKTVALLRRHVRGGGAVRVEAAAGLALAQWRGRKRPADAVALATDRSSGDFLAWLDEAALADWTGDEMVKQAAETLVGLGRRLAA